MMHDLGNTPRLPRLTADNTRPALLQKSWDTAGYEAPTARYRKPKSSKRPGASVWKRSSDKDGVYSPELWLDSAMGASRSGCCSGNLQKLLEDNSKPFGATDGSTHDNPVLFGTGTSPWPKGAKEKDSVSLGW